MMKIGSCAAILLVIGCGKVKNPGGGADGGGGGGENQPPTDITLSAASVAEQAAPGTVVGSFAAEDPDADDSHTFELTDDAGGLFAIDGTDLVVADGPVINYETAATRTVEVTATDAAGGSVAVSFDVEILDLREVVNTLDDGAGSLRQAIAEALPGETILFDTGDDLRISVLSPLVLSKAVTIRGPRGDTRMQLDGNGAVQVIQVTASANVTLQDLEITGGSNGVGNQGTLLVERMSFLDNVAAGNGRGGAIANGGTLIARDSLFQGNPGFNGGAVAADGDSTRIEGCTFVSNTTSGNSGAGIVGGRMRVVNSTFHDNQTTGADRVGGGIGIFGSGQNVVAFSTFTANAATGTGGGIYLAPGSSLTLRGSIFAGNSGPTGGPDLMAGGSVDATYNVVSNAADSGLTEGVGGNVLGQTVTLGELGDNGGPTPTQLPADGAISIDLVPPEACTGSNGAALEHDQRGVARPLPGTCDAGSVERD